MKLSQETLGQVVRNYNGDAFKIGDRELTLRMVLIESIFVRDDGRPGEDKLRGYNLANTLSAPTGDVELKPDEVKLILDRADTFGWHDRIYGILNDHIGVKSEASQATALSI